MRRLLKSLAVLSVTPVALALPVVSRPGTAPRAVAPRVSEHDVRGIDAASASSLAGWGRLAGPATARPLALTPPLRSRTFSAIGVTWDAGPAEPEVMVRVRQGGAWTPWHPLDSDLDHEPDTSTAEARNAALRGGTSPWYSGPADGFQVRVAEGEGGVPSGVRVALVDPGTSPADRLAGSPTLGSSAAMASAGRPSYVTRAQWGADERLRSGTPDYGDTIKMGFVHHTDTSNSYTSSQSAAMVRGVYAFHTRSRGWSDIGYNFLVDKYGRIFEGRYGGVDRPVIGAHTGGFNTDTFGVSLLGNYTSVVPSSAQLGALQRTFAWKLGLHYANPLSRTTMTSKGGSKYASGTKVTLNNVSGHRDAGLTACPGSQTYNRLPTIRSAIKSLIGASLYYPSVSSTTPLYLTTPSVTVRSAVAHTQAWRLDVRNARTGSLLRQVTGPSTTSISAVWNLKDSAGRYVPPDTYALTLSSWTSKTKALPYKVVVQVRSPLPSGIVMAHADGVPYALVENGSVVGVTGPLGRAVRPQPALLTHHGSRSALAPATAPPRDGMFVRSGTGAAYVVVEGSLRAVSPDVASALGLTSPVTLPAAVLRALPAGPAWTDTVRHPDGQVVRSPDSTLVWRIEAGRRRPFTSVVSRNRWAKGWVAPTATAADMALPVGAALPPPEGIVLRTETGAGIVSGGTFRPLASPDTLGYAVSTAPLAIDADLAALPPGAPVEVDRHPSGTLLRNGSGYIEVLGASKRVVDPALVATDPRLPVLPAAGELSALAGARWLPPAGLAGRAGDGTVRVVESGRLVTLDPSVASALGYSSASLPALEAVDFGPLPLGSGLGSASVHPSGTVVTDGSVTWLLDAGTRRPLAASLVTTWLGRPPLAATSGDLALPVGPAAPPQNGAWLVTSDGVRWLVVDGVRRSVSAAVAKRLGLGLVTPVPVVAAELQASTTAGGVVP